MNASSRPPKRDFDFRMPFATRAEPSVRLRVERHDAVGLAESDRAQDDALGPVQADALPVAHGHHIVSQTEDVVADLRVRRIGP